MKETIKYLKEKLHRKDTIVVGVSGGPDSMCLLFLLLQLKEKLNLNIICAHVNHNVRKESEQEKEMVKAIAKKNDCTFEYFKIEKYEKENFENSARKKRYHFFEELVKKYNAEYLMTAHHGDDLMETILMRLVRGSNLGGYAGFKKETNYETYQLIRPLIHTTKESIIEFNKQNHIEYCIDSSNKEEKYTRNRYRLNLLPLLKKENKNVHTKFLKFSEELYSIEQFLQNKTENALTLVYNSDKVNLQEFNKLDALLQKRVLEYILQKEYREEIISINKQHVEKIIRMCKSSKPNVSISLPKKRVFVKNYDFLFLKKEQEKKECNLLLENSIELNENEKLLKIPACDIEKSNYILRLNSQEIELPLRVRYRKSGDFMEVKNLDGSKKIKDIFINEKIPFEKRNTWPIVVDNKNTILWIPGVKKSKFDKNKDEFYDIIYKYVISEEK